nr:Gag-Pol polyprotein [Tanacetum cinerariifolium]
MANLSEDIQCVGSDIRPPMLDRYDFESWQQCICLYCLGKDKWVNILKLIDKGLFKMGKFKETLAKGAEGALHLGPEQDRVFADLTPDENERFKGDIRAMNILLKGLPKDIYTLINHYTYAKDIWDNVKMLLEEPHAENDEVIDDEFINIFSTPIQDQGEISSRHVDSSNMHTFYQRYPSEHRWTKDHPLEQVIGNPSQSVRTRRQLESDAEMCMFALTVSRTEPKNIKEAMDDSAWIESMQEELHQFDRLDVWELVDRPLCTN